MIKNFKITPVRYADSGDPNKTLVLDLFNPYENGVAVKSVTGLGPVKAKVSMSDYASMPGSKFTGARQSSRSIGFNLVFLDDTVVVETLRHRSYLYFPVCEKVIIEIETDYRKVKTEGYVESNEPSIWGRDLEGCSVSILCESPYLESPDVITYEIASVASAFHFPFSSKESPKELLFGYPFVGDSIIVHNDGDIESGCIFEIIALKDISNPAIYHPEDNTSFQLLINMDAGDKVIINTKIGQKSAVLKRGEETHNVINYIREGSVWFSLKPGDTVFSILYSSTITKTKTETNLSINAYRNNCSISDIKIGAVPPQEADAKPTVDNPVAFNIPETIGATITRHYWSDENTDRTRYDVEDEEFPFSQSLQTISNFGGGYIDVLNKKLMVTRIKYTIPTNVSYTDYKSGAWCKEFVIKSSELPNAAAMKTLSTPYAEKFKYVPGLNNSKDTSEAYYLIKSYFDSNPDELYLDGIFWGNDGTLHVFEATNYKKISNDPTLRNRWGGVEWLPGVAKVTPGDIIIELNEPIAYDILATDPSPDPRPGSHDEGSTTGNYVVNPDLLNYINTFNNKHAILNSIDAVSLERSATSITYSLDINSIYDYYNFPSGEQSVIDISDGYHWSFTYFVCSANFNSEGYKSFTCKTSNENGEKTFTMDWSTLNVVPFYGGIVDFTNGKLIGKYDSEGNPLQEDQVIDISSVATAVGAPNDKDGYTITVTNGTLNKLVYPLPSTDKKNRMNLKIKHFIYYYGI